MPDYEKHKFEIIPSDKPVTQSIKPHFTSDLLPKKPRIAEERQTNSPPDFKF